ncbi:MAG: winged helix-turn-helix transcriptional regulator [Roseibium sp.]|uniref:MarR family winged helix-turn-helix transcriptional regulator n=1 Tax=Roseibium sp. TaxID=1936156 RepID=UPI001B0CA54E|nr:MarR family winged helix-turn-helix transcriptional regulator [Roseibium sp.]MBO6890654.1 winged helix-turn-helix transcriptional regulator [Roseibium sp.]MBO6933034.1 winged helix-turn-helix transcriptional regulator [Roseibium sp.]
MQNHDTRHEDLSMDAWVRLQRASTAVLERVEARLKAAGFPPLGWYDVLLELRRAEDRSLRPVEIERHTLLAQYNVSRLIDRIAAAGYADKKKSPEDGRGIKVCLTRKGETLLEEMWPVYREAVQREFAEHMSDSDMKTISSILKKLVSQSVK